MDSLPKMPKQTVIAAGAVVTLAAVVGVYLGVSRSLSAPTTPGDDAGPIVPAVTPVASAKPILTPAPTMDEAEVRKIAREEAQAILAKPAVHKPAATDDDDNSADPGQLTPITPPVLTLPPAKPVQPAPQG
jgi:hypothetical protein